MPPPSKRLSPVCKVSSIGCSTMIGSGALGCVACQAASAVSSLAGKVARNFSAAISRCSSSPGDRVLNRSSQRLSGGINAFPA